MSCCAVGCANRFDKNHTTRKFYRIPSTRTPFKANKRRLWLQAIRRTNWNEQQISNARICNEHFISGEASDDIDNPDFVPSIFSYSSQSNKEGDAKLMRSSMDPPVSPHSADEETPVLPDQNPKYQRSLRSLHLLTIKFVRILQEAKEGELDLREAVKILNVAQKRRIYDITNVLEGVGLVRKMSKSMIKWMGALRDEDEFELEKRKMELKSELEDLEQKELLLDQQKLWVEQSIRNTKEDCSHLTYVNHEDICSCFTGHTLLVVRAPPGTQLDVPIPKAVQDSPAKYQIHLKSVKGPIDVVLLNKHSASSAPVVLPVPPPEEILQRAQLAMSASNEKESRSEPCLASANTKHFTESKRTAVEDVKPRQSPSWINAEPNRTDASEYLSKGLQELMDPLKGKMNADILTQLLVSEVFSPLLHLSKPSSDHDYSCNLDDSEGVCDLFDVPMLNV